jgi:putative DNA primase/helicase
MPTISESAGALASRPIGPDSSADRFREGYELARARQTHRPIEEPVVKFHLADDRDDQAQEEIAEQVTSPSTKASKRPRAVRTPKPPPPPFTDDEAARLVVSVLRTTKAPKKAEIRRLGGHWSTLANKAREAGESGIEEAIEWVRGQAPERADAIEQALAVARAAPAPAEDEINQADLDAEQARRHLTDLGNAERLVARFGRNLRHVAAWKKWLVWDGRRWVLDDAAGATRFAKQTARRVYSEVALIDNDEARERHANWARSSENKPRIDSMLALATSEKEVTLRASEFDRDPWLLNCQNGTLDLRTGELRPHHREDLITKLSPVENRPAALCPYWLDTLDLVFGGSRSLIDHWQRLCGCILTGTVTEQILPILFGTGENGKSTILNALLVTLGGDYAMKAPHNLLMVKRHDAHPTELADLCGKRLVVAIESGEGARINEVLVKELTGSDPIRARRMKEDFWQFDPTHKVLLCTNHRPVIRGTDHAIWRRIALIPFNIKVPAERKDKSMPAKLAQEAPGILAWCVRGCLEWQRGGLNPPPEVQAATNAYRAEQDVLARFIKEECMVLTGLQAPAKGLYDAYTRWADQTRETAVSLKAFGESIAERGFEKKRSNSGIWYHGIGLRAGDSTDTRAFD